VRVVKAVLDRVLAAFALVLFSPVFAGLALWIVLESGRPVIFRQQRAGKNGVPFSMLKFRTMVANAVELGRELNLGDDPYGLLPNDPRITRSGRFLRRTSLDELPQLWNVLRGEMSLVGPRPLPLRDFQRLEGWHRKRYLVLPGVTGLWQISGRSNLGFDDLVRLDFFYLENWSIWLDISILAKTIPAVLSGRGAY